MSINSLCLETFKYGANHPWLNPQTEEGINEPSDLIAKPFRGIARLVYGFACTTIVSATGTLYHGYRAAVEGFYHKNTDRALAHLIAGSKDAATLAITLIAMRIFYGAYKFSKVAYANYREAAPTLNTLGLSELLSHPAYIDFKIANKAIVFSALLLSISPCLIVSPFAFAVKPDTFKK